MAPRSYTGEFRFLPWLRRRQKNSAVEEWFLLKQNKTILLCLVQNVSFLKVLPPISLQSLRGLPGLAGWEGSACPGADGASRGDSRCHLPAAWQWQCSGHSPLLAGHRNMSWGWLTVPGLCRLPNPLIFLSFGAMFRKASAPAVYSLWGLVFVVSFWQTDSLLVSCDDVAWNTMREKTCGLCAISKHAQGVLQWATKKEKSRSAGSVSGIHKSTLRIHP